MLVNWNLGLTDMIVIVLSVILSVGIGIYFRLTGGRQKTVKEYVLADKKGSVILVSLSIMSSLIYASSVALPGESYSFGVIYSIRGFGTLLVACPVYAFIIYPIFFKMQLISPFEYLEKRFNYKTRFVTSIISCMVTLLSSGVSLFTPSLALESMMGIAPEHSIIIMSILCTFYSSVGGIKAVIISDAYQALLMYASLIAVIAIILAEKGYFTILNDANENGRINFYNFELDLTTRYTIWNLMTGGTIGILTTMVTNETIVQRYMTFKTMKQVIQTTFLSSLFISLIVGVGLYSGLALYSEYSTCDPVMSGKINKYDELLPFFVQEKLSHMPGIPGLFISGVIAGSLSTVSSIINSLAALMIEDYIRPFYLFITKKECSESQIITYAKLLSVAIGVVSVIIAFLVRKTSSLLQVILTLQNAVPSPILGTFLLGMFVPFANETGVLSGMVLTIPWILWGTLGGPRPLLHRLPMSVAGCEDVTNLTTLLNTTAEPQLFNEDYFYLYRVSYMWYSLFGLVFTMVIGTIVSYITYDPAKIADIDPDLFIPIISGPLKRKHYYKSTNTEEPGKGTTDDTLSEILQLPRIENVVL